MDPSFWAEMEIGTKTLATGYDVLGVVPGTTPGMMFPNPARPPGWTGTHRSYQYGKDTLAATLFLIK